MRYVRFSLVLAGIRWSGDWSVEGAELCVRSAYGSRTCKLGRCKPERLAERLLLEILAERLAEMEAARLGGRVKSRAVHHTEAISRVARTTRRAACCGVPRAV